MRKNYWSCSPFADWLRGTPKPGAQTGLGWAQWRKASKEKNPIRYWMAEEGLDYIQSFLWWPIDRVYSVKYYINNRWVTRTHCLTAHPRDLPRGEWRDVGNRFLPCLFNELVDFVEIELAWANFRWDEQARQKHKVPWWANGWWRIRIYRNPAAGLDYLDWSSKLVKNEDWGLNPGDPEYGEPTHQALGAIETLALYKWWKEVYPNRPDPHDISGWTSHCKLIRDRARSEGFDEFTMMGSEYNTEEEDQRSTKALDLSNKIEEEYKQEDEAMMVRLIKIRDYLWT